MSLLDDAPTTPKYEDLVGEGKKYKTNDEFVAAMVEKDRLLTQRENEKRALETDLQARKNLAELSDELISKARKAGEPMEPNHREAEPNREEKNSQIDLKAEFEKMLRETRTVEKREANIDVAKQKLKELYGSDYKATLEKVATELGVPTKFLDDMAGTSPDGFVKTVTATIAPDKKNPSAPPQGSLDLAKNGSSTVRKNYAYYRDIMKTDFKRYMSLPMQKEMHEQAMEQGPAFYQ